MKIHSMCPADYAGVKEVWLSCKGMGLNDVDDSEAGITKFIDRNPSTCFIAEEEGRVVGAIMAGYDGRRGYIYHTAVRPEVRGRGIGRALVHAAVQALTSLGATKVALVVFSSNAQGNAFWQKLGFSLRTDLDYRDITLIKNTRFDT